MKIDLHQRPLNPFIKNHPVIDQIQWKKSLPFFVNPRGVLIHRVRFAITYFWDGDWSHDVATYWCSNSGRGEFVADPPKDRLLCAYCEAKAVAAGEKTASELAGRHVCVGTLKAVRQCCTGIEN